MALTVGVDGFRMVLGLTPGSVLEQGVAEELSAASHTDLLTLPRSLRPQRTITSTA